LSAQVAYALITHPADAMRRIRTDRAPGWAVVMLVAASVSFAVGFALASAAHGGGRGPGMLAAFVGSRVVMALGAWIFVGALTHSAACLMGGYGHLVKFLTAYAMASMPFTLCTPAALLLSLLGGLGLPLLVVVVLPVLALWWWGLTISGIKELYGLSTGAAVVASILPYALIVGLLAAAVCADVVTLSMKGGACL